MTDEDQTPDDDSSDFHPSPGELWPMLVLMWSSEDPAHVGEVLMVSSELGRDRCFGRPSQSGGGDLPRVHLVLQRPGLNLHAPGLIAPRVSRDQLLISSRGNTDKLRLRSVGRATLYVNGVAKTDAMVQPGDLVRLGSELLLRCSLRPPVLRSLRYDSFWRPYPFGWSDHHHLVGEAPCFWDLRRQICDTARTLKSALIVGDHGVGKGSVARALHEMSPRSQSRLITQKMSGMSDEMAALALNGARRGYSPGIESSLYGLIQTADRGSLYLSEVGELSDRIQAMLCKLVPMGEYTILGDVAIRYADVATIASTSRPLDHLRPDLPPRFRTVIRVPSLIERPEDIPLVMAHLARQLAPSYPSQIARLFHNGDIQGYPRFSRSFVEEMITREWPANHHHLRAAIDAALGYSLELEQHRKGDGRIHGQGLPVPKGTPGDNWQERRLKVFGATQAARIDLWLDYGCKIKPATEDERAAKLDAKSRTTFHTDRPIWLNRALEEVGGDVDRAMMLLSGVAPGRRYVPMKSLKDEFNKHLCRPHLRTTAETTH